MITHSFSCTLIAISLGSIIEIRSMLDTPRTRSFPYQILQYRRVVVDRPTKRILARASSAPEVGIQHIVETIYVT